MYENELNQIAYENVQRDEYPEQIPQIDVEPKRQELREYEDGTRERPQPKTAYIVLIDNLSGEIARLESENADIREQNRLARQVVDDKYTTDIETYKELEATKWEAIRMVRNRLMTECDWTQITDAPTFEDAGWLAYRQALRDIPQDHEVPDDVVWPVMP